MQLVWLSWFICCACLLIAIMASAVTYHPTIQYLGSVVPAVFGGLALLAAGTAVTLGRLPSTHHIHLSKPFWASLVAIAVTVVLFLILAM